MNPSQFQTFPNDRLRLGNRLTQVTAGSGSTVYWWIRERRHNESENEYGGVKTNTSSENENEIEDENKYRMKMSVEEWQGMKLQMK